MRDNARLIWPTPQLEFNEFGGDLLHETRRFGI